MLKTLCFLALGLFAALASARAHEIWGYHIGNSLTNDSRPLEMATAYQALGLTPFIGHHIDSAKSAWYISQHPNGAYDAAPNPVLPYDGWSNALPGYTWDYVTIQSHSGATGLQEFAGISTLIDAALANPANANTTFYIYAAWPRQSTQLTFRQVWEQPYTDYTLGMQFRRDYFDGLHQQVQAAYPGQSIGVIPVGEALARIDTHLINGAVPGLNSAWELYRDSVHMDYGNGRYVAHATTLATILNTHPSDLTITAFNVDPAFKALADQAIWDTLTGQPMPSAPPPPPPSVIVYDPFASTPTVTEGNYLANVDLMTSPNRSIGSSPDWSGEGGWGGSWNQAASLMPVEGSLVYEQPGAYLDTRGGKLQYVPGASSNLTNRRFISGNIAEGTVYFSLLAQWDGFGGTQQIGVTDSTDIGGGQYSIVVNSSGARLRLFGNSSTDSETVPLALGETYLFVTQVDIDGGMTLWINPDLTKTPETLAEGDYYAKLAVAFPDGVTGKPVNVWVMTPRTTSSALDMYFDEVRIGTEWHHVMDVEIRGDFNGDGVLSGLDIPGFKTALADPADWSYNFDRDANRLGDFNADGVFSGLDIPGFKAALAGTSASAVPEPATALMLLGGLIVAWRRRD